MRSGGAERRLDRGFSVNLSPAETDLTRMSTDELEQIFGETDFQLARSREEIQERVSSVRVGRELYPWIISLMVIFLGCELVMANRFYRDD